MSLDTEARIIAADEAQKAVADHVRIYHTMPPPPPPGDVLDVKGAFLSLLNYEFIHHGWRGSPISYPFQPPSWRQELRAAYTEQGLTHLPMGAMRRDDSDSLMDTFIGEMADDHKVVIHMLLTDDVGKALPNDFDTAMFYIKQKVRRFRDSKNLINCLGWEAPDITRGSGEPIGDPPRRWGWTGAARFLLEATQIITGESDVPFVMHGRPNWWGCADVDDHLFASQLKAAGAAGWLYQSTWDAPDFVPDDPGGGVVDDYLMLRNPHNPDHPGVLGRLDNHGLIPVWFEMARDWDTQQRRLGYLIQDDRHVRYC